MPQCARPSVLVVAREYGSRSRIATILEEAGIAVTVDEEGQAALAAAARDAYDLAIVVLEAAGGRDATALAAAVRTRHPALEVLCIPDTAVAGADAGGRRHFVGCVRERLLLAGKGPTAQAAADDAERVIAMAQIACLYRRREAANRSGAQPLAEALGREIGRVTAQSRAHEFSR